MVSPSPCPGAGSSDTGAVGGLVWVAFLVRPFEMTAVLDDEGTLLLLLLLLLLSDVVLTNERNATPRVR